MGLVALWHVDSSKTRDQTHTPCFDRQFLNQWTTREVWTLRGTYLRKQDHHGDNQLWSVPLVVTNIKIPMLASCLLFKLRQIHCHLYYNIILTAFLPFCILIFSRVTKKWHRLYKTVHGVLKARILKWYATPYSSGPHSVRPLHHDPALGWPHMVWLSLTELDKAVVCVIRLASLLWLWFQPVCPLMPSHNTYRLTWVSLTLDVGCLFMAAPAKCSHCSLPFDRKLKEELPRSVGAQYATGDQWRNNSGKNEGMEPKQKQYPVVDVTGDRGKVQCCKEQLHRNPEC